MMATRGWERILVGLSVLVVVTYLVQALGGHLNTATSIVAVICSLGVTAWMLRGQTIWTWSFRGLVIGLAVLGVAGASHLLLPIAPKSSSVLISNVVVKLQGRNLLVRGMVERIGVHGPIPIVIGGGGVMVRTVVLNSAPSFSATLPVNLDDPCTANVRIQARSQTVLGPFVCSDRSQ